MTNLRVAGGVNMGKSLHRKSGKMNQLTDHISLYKGYDSPSLQLYNGNSKTFKNELIKY